MKIIKFTKKKVLEYLRVIKNVDIGILIPATLSQVIMNVLYIGILRPSTLPIVITKDVMVVMLVEVDICQKIPATLSLSIG